MNSRVIECNGALSLRIESDRVLIYDLTSAIEFLETIYTETGLQRVIIDRHIFSNDFFLFGMSQINYVVQLLGQYGTKLAVIGDFSDVDSALLNALNGPGNTSLFLIESEQAGLAKLTLT